MEKIINNIEPLLQKDYGQPGDCTLTSITIALRYYLNNKKTPNEVYNIVEKYSKQFLYNGNVYGSIPVFTKAVIKKCATYFKISKTSKSAYLKGTGYNFNSIKKIIDKNNPIVLSIFNIKGTEYQKHTILIIGYNDKNEVIIYDNWNKNKHYIPFNNISKISSINYLI